MLLGGLTLTGNRYAAGSVVGRKFVPGAKTPITITDASVQPVLGKDLELLPEGRRNEESYFVFTETQLNVSNSNNKTQADELTYNGLNFEVIKCQPWQNGIISHYRALISLKKRND